MKTMLKEITTQEIKEIINSYYINYNYEGMRYPEHLDRLYIDINRYENDPDKIISLLEDEIKLRGVNHKTPCSINVGCNYNLYTRTGYNRMKILNEYKYSYQVKLSLNDTAFSIINKNIIDKLYFE